MSMDTFTYWWPFVAFGMAVWVYGVSVGERRRAEAIIAEEKEMLAAVDTSIAVLAQRNRDFAEALELMDYGARDEAIELLRNWGEVRVGTSS